MAASLLTMFEKDNAAQVGARDLLSHVQEEFYQLCRELNGILAQNGSSYDFFLHDEEFHDGRIDFIVRNNSADNIAICLDVTVELSENTASTYKIKIDYDPDGVYDLSYEDSVEEDDFPATERGAQDLSVKLIGLISPYLTFLDRVAYFKMKSEQVRQSVLDFSHG